MLSHASHLYSEESSVEDPLRLAVQTQVLQAIYDSSSTQTANLQIGRYQKANK